MSAIKSKIVVRAQPAVAASAAKMPAASTVKVAAKTVPAKKAVVVAAPKKATKKVVVEEEIEESEVEEVEERMTPAQIIASMEEQLSALRVALKVKGLTKSGKPRKQREYTGPSEKQAAWSAYVQEVREEYGYEMDDEGNAVLDKKGEPKWAMSYKDAMKEAGDRRKAEASDSASVASSAKSAPKVAPKKAAATVVVAKKPVAAAAPGKKAAVAAAPAPAKKTAAELRAEFLAKKAAAAAAAAAPEETPAPEEETAEEESNEAVEWEFQGQQYYKTSDNLCWMITHGDDRIWAGVYLPEEDRIDDSVEEPTYDA